LLKLRTLAAAAIAIALLGAACSDGSTTSTSTAAAIDSPDEVVFSSGELPATIPDNFPLPAGSTVGSTMVVTDTGFTEVIVRVSAELGITAEFFEQNLDQNGFVVDSSNGEQDKWVIEFNLDGVKGTIDITEPQSGISQAVVRYNVP